jgi:hypothetical protein
MAERINPMVMNGPTPIIFNMFTAVDWTKPMPRTSFSEVRATSGGRFAAELSGKECPRNQFASSTSAAAI